MHGSKELKPRSHTAIGKYPRRPVHLAVEKLFKSCFSLSGSRSTRKENPLVMEHCGAAFLAFHTCELPKNAMA
jgi:hypothetical protein